jgi:predicted small lipoprotein YifL
VTTRPSKIACLVLLGLSCAVLVSGCGRRGALEPPPGTDARNQASQPQASTSGFGASPAFRPARETEVEREGRPNAGPDIPVMPQTQDISQSSGVQTGPQTISAGSAGLRTTTGQGGRRSPPPTTPFILDPLL